MVFLVERANWPDPQPTTCSLHLKRRGGGGPRHLRNFRGSLLEPVVSPLFSPSLSPHCPSDFSLLVHSSLDLPRTSAIENEGCPETENEKTRKRKTENGETLQTKRENGEQKKKTGNRKRRTKNEEYPATWKQEAPTTWSSQSTPKRGYDHRLAIRSPAPHPYVSIAIYTH